MPKTLKTYTNFTGGLNTADNSRSINDNELAAMHDATIDRRGFIISSGKFADNTSDYRAPAIDASQAGYGLFQHKSDFDQAGNNESIVRTLLADADDGGQVEISVYSSDTNTWTDAQIGLGAVTGSEQGKVIYHIADGDVRICDTNILNVSTSIKKYGYVERAGGWSGNNPGGSVYSAGWEVSDTLLSKPTAGIVGIDLRSIAANTGGSDSTTLASADAGTNAFENVIPNLSGSSFTDATCDYNNDPTIVMDSTSLIRVGHKVAGTGIPSDSYVSSITNATTFELSASTTGGSVTNGTLTFSGGHYFAIASNNTFDAILEVDDDHTLGTSAGGADWSTGSVRFSIFPPVGEGWNIGITLTNSAGTWAAGTYEFASTFIYDGNQESLPFEIGGEVVVAANDKLTCTVMATEALGNSKFDGRITGGRLYYRLTRSDDEWALLGDLDISKGTRASLESTYSDWALTTTITSFVYSSFISDSQNLDTYQSLNGYDQDSSFISLGLAGEKYQTSVVSNRRSFIANIRYTDSKGTIANKGDTIRYSEVNRFDTFPELNFIDIGVNDGESFIKLEAFADRILAFKEKSLYIINIGSGSDTQWFLESEHRNMGVEFHAATVKTDFGIAWVNKNGLYFYDGSQIRNLQTKIHQSEDYRDIPAWSNFVNKTYADTMIGYEPKKKHLVIIRDAGSAQYDGNSGDAFIYSFETNSFSFVNNFCPDVTKTNMITDAYANLSVGTALDEIETYNGEPVAGTGFEITLKDDDFGLSGTVKKVYGMQIEYASANSSGTNDFKYFHTDSTGTKQGIASAFIAPTTSGDLDIFRGTFANAGSADPKSVNSFQPVFISASGSSLHRIKGITVEYRPIKKRIT